APTAEDIFLAERAAAHEAQLASANAGTVNARPGDWVEFRGPDRDGVIRGESIATDWGATSPQPVWRHRVGPGWSSVTVGDGRLFPQEQQGDRESVVCYNAATGKEIWSHEDAARFWESVAGAGPRATPTFTDGRLYTFGATGILNCLDPATGTAHWTRDVAAEV